MFEHTRTTTMLNSKLVTTSEAAQALFKAEMSIAEEIRQLLLHADPIDEQAVIRTYARQWETQFGGMNDPQVQANVEAVAAALRATREANARSVKP